jgi:hypothetical protein
MGEAKVSWRVRFRFGKRARFEVGSYGIVAVEALALSPDGEQIAFVGVTEAGDRDLFVLDTTAKEDRLIRLTSDPHAERHVSWGAGGIVFSSDATGHGRFNLFRAHPDQRGHIERLTTEARDHFDPAILPGGKVLFVAHDELGANVYELGIAGLHRRTSVSTGVFDVGPGPHGALWVLHHYQGRLVPALLPGSRLIDEWTVDSMDLGVPRAPPRLKLTGDFGYSAAAWSSWQFAGAMGFLGATSDGIFGQLIALAHDRLRNHSLLLTMFAYGSPKLIDFAVLYTNGVSRSVWGLGLFQDVRYRLDRSVGSDGFRFLSGERFFGALGVIRYPLDRFRNVQLGLSAGGVARFIEDDTRDALAARGLLEDWRSEHDGLSARVEATASYGYSTIRYRIDTGPIAGGSALIAATVAADPVERNSYAALRVDGERYLRISGRSNIFVRSGAAYSFGALAPGFYLSSFDTLRGVPYGDERFLLGTAFLFATTELQFPLNPVVRIPGIDVEGLLAFDGGAAGDSAEAVWDRRVLDFALGTNFGFGPLVIRLHFAWPIDIGAPLPNQGNHTVNFSFGYRYQ